MFNNNILSKQICLQSVYDENGHNIEKGISGYRQKHHPTGWSCYSNTIFDWQLQNMSQSVCCLAGIVWKDMYVRSIRGKLYVGMYPYRYGYYIQLHRNHQHNLQSSFIHFACPPAVLKFIFWAFICTKDMFFKEVKDCAESRKE